MNFKKRGFFSFFVAMMFVLTACGKKAPELSFEETLKVYSQNNLAIREVLAFLNDTGHQVKSDLNLNMALDIKEQMGGMLTLKSSSVNDNAMHDAESTLDLSADLENKGGGTASKIKGNLNLSVLIKSFQPFFKLNTFELETEPKEIAGMAMGFSEMFKEKWLTLENPELIELLKHSAKDEFSFWQNKKFYEADPVYYTGVTSTTYDGNPAWKVDFNMEEIRKIALEVYDASQTQNAALFTGEELLAQQEQVRADFVSALEKVNFENVEAYFIIRSAEKVDFLLKNADILTPTMLMHVTQSLEGEVLTTMVTIKEEETDVSKIIFILDPEGKGKFAFTLKVILLGEDTTEKELFSLSGKLQANLSEKKIALIPYVEVVSDLVNLKLDWKLEAKKTSGATFKAPEDAQDIQEMLGAFGNFWVQPVGLNTLGEQKQVGFKETSESN